VKEFLFKQEKGTKECQNNSPYHNSSGGWELQDQSISRLWAFLYPHFLEGGKSRKNSVSSCARRVEQAHQLAAWCKSFFKGLKPLARDLILIPLSSCSPLVESGV
jgi:hypothetical protein